MYPKAIIAVLLVALLIFGCTTTPSGPSVQPPANQTPPPNQTPPVNQTPPANQSTQPPGNDLIGKTFDDLIGLGVPIQCDITTESGTAKLYKGIGNDMRIETPVSGGMCPIMVSIMKADKYYIGCKEGSIMPGSDCQWLVFNATAASGGAYQKPDYSNVPAAQISCIPWVLDESMLQAPANACDLQNLITIPSG